MAQYKWFKKTFLFLVQTQPVLAWFTWNRKRKEKRFAAAYPRLERFIDELRSIRVPNKPLSHPVNRV
jgi:hypothetical protein